MSQTKVQLVNDVSGNVGVSTASPVAQTLAGGTAITPVLDLKGVTQNNTSGILQFTRKDNATQGSCIYSSGDDAGLTMRNTDGNGMGFYNGTTIALRIDPSGRVLIGTTTEGNGDADEFTIANTSGANMGMTIRSGTGALGNIFFSDGTSGGSEYRGMIQYGHNNDSMRFATAETERMRIDSAGRLLINRTSAFSTGTSGTESAKLQVGISSTSGTVVGFADTGGYDTNVMVLNHARAGANSNSLAGVMIQFRNTVNNTVGSITSDLGATNYGTSSDYRLKENVVGISDGITRLKTLKPCRFNWKVDKNHTIDGFIAHEVTAVPEAISGVKDGMKAETYYEEGDTLPSGKVVGDVKTYSSTEPEYQNIDQSKLVPLLTAALQEEIGKREALETRVATLEAA